MRSTAFSPAPWGAPFFPASNELDSLIAAFGVFAAGYFMRPLGGVLFGHIGDRLGRKPALVISTVAMALPTCAIGLLPTAAEIGAWAAGLYQRHQILTRRGFPFRDGCDSRLAKEIRHVIIYCTSGRLRRR